MQVVEKQARSVSEAKTYIKAMKLLGVVFPDVLIAGDWLCGRDTAFLRSEKPATLKGKLTAVASVDGERCVLRVTPQSRIIVRGQINN